jgi:nucleoside-diphosphate-sugar epimerase
MILVTGGTGLVGAHLLYRLSLTESKIRAIYRTESRIKKTKHVFSYFTGDVDVLFNKIEWVEADILDLPRLLEAFQDVSHVYHSAALVSFDPNDYQSLRKSNIEGTANIVNLCLANNVDKLCYVSSIATLSKDINQGIITEKTEWNPEDDNSVYAITKYGAEMEVWRGTQEGLKTVIVNPGIILGGGFWKLGSGALFRKIHKGMAYYTTGILGYVDVHDVVDGMIKLMQSQIINERYIMVADNWSFKEFSEKVARELNVNPPKKEAKPWQLQVAWRLDWLSYFFGRKYRKFTKQMASSVLNNSVFSSDKLKSDLNFEFKPLEDSIRQTCELFMKDLNH